MSRPSEFCKPYLTTNITPYQLVANPGEVPERGTSNGGVFHRGQTVWMQASPAPLSQPHTILGFVDGLGHVFVDGRILRAAETVGTH